VLESLLTREGDLEAMQRLFARYAATLAAFALALATIAPAHVSKIQGPWAF